MKFPDNPTYEQVFEPLLKMDKQQALQWMDRYIDMKNGVVSNYSKRSGEVRLDAKSLCWIELNTYFTYKNDPEANEYINNLFSDQTIEQ